MAAHANDGARGAAYVFERSRGGANGWGETRKLVANDAASRDQLGVSVSISGDLAVAGAPADDDGGADSGSIYVFSRDLGGLDNWGQLKKLRSSDNAAGDRLAWAMAISGDTIVAGSHPKHRAQGAAYVFERNLSGPENWGQAKKLRASDAVDRDQFGTAIAISGDTAVVAAWPKNASAGAVYVFERNLGGPNAWGEARKLVGSDTVAGDKFGYSVAIDGDLVLVGALGNQGARGAAYLFARDLGGADRWGQLEKLTASDAAPSDQFGISVSISGGAAVVGSFADDDAGHDSGSVYVYRRDQGGANTWGQAQKLTANDAAPEEWFGYSVAISADQVVVGSPYNGRASVVPPGSAYVFGR